MMNSNWHMIEWILGMGLRKSAAAIVSITAIVFVALAMPSAQAQTYTVLYSFTGLKDGGVPDGRLLAGAATMAVGWCLSWIRRAKKPCCTISTMGRAGRDPMQA